MSFWVTYAVPCVLAVVCYINGLPGDFLHDDVFAIERNRDVRGEASLSEVFHNDFWGRSIRDGRSHKSFRPLTVLSFRFDFLLSSGDPRWFHAVNIFLHSSVTALVVFVSMRVLRTTPTVAAMAAAHFAVHPVHTEAVSGIVGRADVLSALFFLASLYCYSRCVPDVRTAMASSPTSPSSPSTPSSSSSRRSLARDFNYNDLSTLTASTASLTSTFLPQLHSKPNSQEVTTNAAVASRLHFLFLLSSLGLAAMAVLCKETGITVLGVACLYDLILHRLAILRLVRRKQITTELKACILRLACVCIAGTVILGLRLWVMDFQQPKFQREDNPAAEATSYLTRVLTFLYLPVLNLWLLLCPVTLSYDWSMGSVPLVTHFSDSRNLWSGLSYTVLLVVAGQSLQSMISATSLEESGDIRTREEERRTSTQPSSPGFVRVMALLLVCVTFLPASNVFFKVGFVVAERVLYLPSFGFSVLLAQGLAQLSGRLPSLKLLLALTFVTLMLVLGVRTIHRNQAWISRRSLFLSGVRTFPNNAKMHYNMANLLRDEVNTEAAEVHYRQAIRLNPDHPSYHLNLGTILTNRSEAESCFQVALRLHPTHVGALVNLASLWIEDGRQAAGMSLLQKALDLDSSHAEALLTLGKALLVQGETRRAGRSIQRAMESRPNWARAHLYYASFLEHTDNLEEALREYMRVIDLDPREIVAMSNAARVLVSLDRHGQAEQLLRRALAVDPSCWDCLSVLATSHTGRGQLTQAVLALHQAVMLAPNKTSITLKYVQALKQAKQTERAHEVFRNLLLRAPDDLTVLTFAYNYAMEEERLADASQHIRQAVAVAEQTRHGSLGKLYFEQGEVYRLNADYERALKYYKKSITEDQHRTEAIVSAGSILYLKKNYGEAEEYYLWALSQDPGHRLAQQNLARLRNVLAAAC